MTSKIVEEEVVVEELKRMLYLETCSSGFLPDEIGLEFYIQDQKENYTNLDEDDARWTFTSYFYMTENGDPIDSLSSDTFDEAVKFVYSFLKNYKKEDFL